MFDPVALEQIVALYINGMAADDIANLLMLSTKDVNEVLDLILPYLE